MFFINMHTTLISYSLMLIFSSMVVSKDRVICDLIDQFREELRLKCIFMMSFDRMKSFSDVKQNLCHDRHMIGWLPIEHQACPLARSRCTDGARLIIIPSTVPISELAKIYYPKCDINDILLYILDSLEMNSNKASLDDLFRDIFISVNCRFIVCENKNDIYKFTEIYKTINYVSLEQNVLGQWNPKSGFEQFQTNLPSIFQQRRNFHQNNLTIGLFQNNSAGRNNSDFHLLTTQRNIWSEIAYYLNIRSTEVFVKEEIGSKLDNGTWTGIIGDVISQKVILAASILQYKERMDAVDFLRVTHSEKYYIFLQRPTPPILVGNIIAYIRPFHLSVWSTLLFVLFLISLCSSLVKWFDNKNNDKTISSLFAESLFNISSIMSVQGSSYTEFVNYTKSGRILILFTFMLSIIIYQSYSTAIMSSLIVMDEILPFNDLQGLMDYGGYEITIYPSVNNILKNNKDPLLNRLFNDYTNKLTHYPKFGSGMDEIVKQHRMAFINLGTSGKMFLSQNPNYDIIFFPLMNQSLRMTFIIGKYNPYTPYLNQKIQQMIEFGIIQRIMSNSLSFYTKSKEQIFTSLDISMMIFPLSILLTGQILSILLFLCEVIIFNIKSIRKGNIKNKI